MKKDELLDQVLAAMQEQTAMLTKMMQEQTAMLRAEIKESETRINVKIENEISGKLDALFDGYKLNHEKSWELEQRMDKTEQRLDQLEMAAS